MGLIKTGVRTYKTSKNVIIRGWASIAGKKEKEGPLGNCFDKCSVDPYFGAKSWESAEQAMQTAAFKTLLDKTKVDPALINMVFAGDLLNQCIGSSFGFINTAIPYYGLYGACSTMAEALALSAIAISADVPDYVVAMTSSHFASSERQFRFPLGYGGQRTPTAQWTVTGAGAVLLSTSGKGPVISAITAGTVVDLGIKDANNMGAAMAPAAWETIFSHLKDTGQQPEDYDYIVTGDLGAMGKDALLALAMRDGVSLGGRLVDCGTMIFDLASQDVHSGGSGCGCSAITLCGYFLDRLRAGKMKRILFCGTGALLSPTSTQQGMSIPGICHAVAIEGN